MEYLYRRLQKLAEGNRYPFHMPGHKRMLPGNCSFFDEIAKIDITEIPGFDDLHHPEEILKAEQERAAALFGAKKSYFLVGGSSVGNLAAICSQTKEGDQIILSRGSHKSVYHALFLNDLKPVYLAATGPDSIQSAFPVKPQDVKKAMEETGAKVVCITSPTYEGLVAEVSQIAQIVHEHDGILIVDEAHGAHLSIMERYINQKTGTTEGITFPKSAVTSGADIVVQSLHKTLPAMTQTAVLHVCSHRVNEGLLWHYLDMLQSTSPSYVLMGSVSFCLDLLEREGEKLATAYFENLKAFYESMKDLKHLHLLQPQQIIKGSGFSFDPSKLILHTGNARRKDNRPYTGPDLAKELLETYEIDTEMSTPDYVLGMTSVADTKEGFERLRKALYAIDQRLTAADPSCGETRQEERIHTNGDSNPFPRQACSIRKAILSEAEWVPVKEARGRISAKYLYCYPPGIPLLTPGEEISEGVLCRIEAAAKSDCTLHGYEEEGLYVLAES
ncbi:MAG: aminotransferase class I/II-fold pyridoxal phosphate-dependent enzyme [Lachnospiraceae bacterium]|nr:aminotransferase class I/II-fold pyridoxal phosphate-dependent enzyme [Lachnospiraceae bacterium]